MNTLREKFGAALGQSEILFVGGLEPGGVDSDLIDAVELVDKAKIDWARLYQYPPDQIIAPGGFLLGRFGGTAMASKSRGLRCGGASAFDSV